MINILIQWLLSHPYTDVTVLISIIEIILRLKPTSKNWSLIDKLHTFLTFILPNLKDKDAIAKIKAEQSKIENLKNKIKESEFLIS